MYLSMLGLKLIRVSIKGVPGESMTYLCDFPSGILFAEVFKLFCVYHNKNFNVVLVNA